ncbi:MAG: TRAP transporter small permease subunit [Acidimicrobiales bacterium]
MSDNNTVSDRAEELLEGLAASDPKQATVEVPGGILGLLFRLKKFIDALARFSGRIVWIMVWVIFALGLFNVVTRYVARFIEKDIIIGEVFDLQWMVFGLMALLGLNYGMREGVNPRIDFWWAEFSDKRKALIDLILHLTLLLPFGWMSVKILWNYSLTALGRKFDGSWPTWKVWDIWEQATDAGGLARGPIKFMILIGFSLWSIQMVGEIIKNGFVLAGRNDLAGIEEREAPLRVE